VEVFSAVREKTNQDIERGPCLDKTKEKLLIAV